MCWCFYFSEGALCEPDLADSPYGYWNHRGKGYDSAQTVGPVWERLVPAGCQGLLVHKGADEANLE